MAINVRKRASGISYIVRVRDRDGEFFPSKSFKTKHEAREHESELLANKTKGSKSRSKSERGRTFSDYWTEWDESCRTEISEGWRISQRQMARDHVLPILGNQKLNEISPVDILKVLTVAKQKDMGPQMRLHLYALMHKMFDDALELFDYVQSNPVRKKMKPQPHKTERRFLKPSQAREFTDAVRDEWLGPAIWIMIYSALRIGELQGLQWWNVDFESSTLIVTQQWKRKEKRFGPLKNGQPSRVPMPEELVGYLSEKKPLGSDPMDFVCPGKDGQMLSYDTFEDGLKRLTKKYNIPEVSPHELRHTSTELWFEAGASQEDVRRLLNHSSEAAIRGYIHKTPERLKRIASSMGASKSHLSLVETT